MHLRYPVGMTGKLSECSNFALSFLMASTMTLGTILSMEFLIDFELSYEASYSDSQNVSLGAAIKRWELSNVDQKPNLEQYMPLSRSKDKVSKFLGMYSSRRSYSDWIPALPDESEIKSADWDTFVQKLRAFYKPTENLTLTHCHFRLIRKRLKPSLHFAIGWKKKPSIAKSNVIPKVAQPRT